MIFQRCNGTHGNDLNFAPSSVSTTTLPAEILGNALPYQQHTANNGKRNQNYL